MFFKEGSADYILHQEWKKSGASRTESFVAYKKRVLSVR